jgi:predicted glycosyltransferase involved in capsule biosynthesis
VPKILNKYKDTGVGVYIGRPSIWGNPFVIGKDGNRDEVIEKYKAWLSDKHDLIQAVKTELKGKNLICFCAPAKCHGDVLLQIANEI